MNADWPNWCSNLELALAFSARLASFFHILISSAPLTLYWQALPERQHHVLESNDEDDILAFHRRLHLQWAQKMALTIYIVLFINKVQLT